jgi:SSS family solute:Na+ symporter
MAIIDYTIVIIYLGLIVIIGLMLQKRASSGIDSYFLGNRGLPWWALGASGMASNMDVSGTMINTAWVFALGTAGLFLEIRGGVTLIMAFLMIFMGKWNRRAQVMTMAEWMRFRFGAGKEGQTARIVTAVSVIVMTCAMITYFAVGSGKFVGTFLNIPDIGIMKNPLEDSETDRINTLMSEIALQRMIVDYDLQTQALTFPETRVVTTAYSDLQSSWEAVRNNPGSVTFISRMNQEMTGFSTALKSMISSVEHAGAESAGLIQTDIDNLKKADTALQSYFRQAVAFQIIFDSEFIAALLMITLAMLYTVASGLYGVVWTDVFQGILIFGTILFICVTALVKFGLPDTFFISVPMKDGTFQVLQTSKSVWTHALPQMKLNFPKDSLYSIYNLFGIAVFFYLVKVTIEGCGGTSQYMIQRYYAAKSDREAGLLSLFWTLLLSFRWPFIAALAVMGISLGSQQGVISDPEKVLPVVVNTMVPIGIKGILVAGLMAAAMSTFDSTVNAGAAYWVKDIYQAFINPKAPEKKLMLHSRWASVLIVVLGLLFSLTIRNINEIWGWITMSIGAGMIIPTLLRWYWWRMNGYGYALGIAGGMISAVIQRLAFPLVPEYVSFGFASGISLIGTIAGTYLSRPTENGVLDNFYKTTRPFGFWNPVRKQLSPEVMAKINAENRRDIISTFFAVPWQVVLFLTMMMVIMKSWHTLFILLGILAVLSAGLYFNWFRHLSTEVKVEEYKQD